MARVLAAAAILLVLAGCGGEEQQAATAPPPAATGADPPAATTGAATETAPAAETTLDTQPAPTEAVPDPQPEPEPEPEPLPGLPRALAGYETWTKLNARPIPPRSPDPHEGTKDVYASAAPSNGTYPDGAIVVKEAVRPGRDFIGLVAMMRKERGAQPDHNDWVWIEWVRDGPGEEFRELARGAVCYGCHVGARETDYVFTR